MKDLEKKLSLFGGLLAGVALLLSMIMVIVGVVARYILNVAVIFVDEYTGYLLVIMTFMALGYTLRTEGHIRVDLLTRVLSEKTQLYLNLMACLITMALTVLLIVQTWHRAWSSYKLNSVSTSPLETPLFIPQVFIPVGFCFLLVALVSFTAKTFRQLRETKNKAKGA